MAQETHDLKSIVAGFRGHRWMYDAPSMASMLMSAGFDEVRQLPPGETGLPDPGGLDLRERDEDSIYFEAIRQ